MAAPGHSVTSLSRSHTVSALINSGPCIGTFAHNLSLTCTLFRSRVVRDALVFTLRSSCVCTSIDGSRKWLGVRTIAAGGVRVERPCSSCLRPVWIVVSASVFDLRAICRLLIRVGIRLGGVEVLLGLRVWCSLNRHKSPLLKCERRTGPITRDAVFPPAALPSVVAAALLDASPV